MGSVSRILKRRHEGVETSQLWKRLREQPNWVRIGEMIGLTDAFSAVPRTRPEIDKWSPNLNVGPKVVFAAPQFDESAREQLVPRKIHCGTL